MVSHGRIEEVLGTVLPGFPSVITSVEDRRKGERLVAFVAAVNVTPQEIWQRLMLSGLPKICVPKPEDIHVVDTLPSLATGKLDLRSIKRMALELASELSEQFVR